jgi:hypothetical protein
MGIVALAVGTGTLDGSACMDASIEVDHEVIADVRELTFKVPLADLLDGDRPALGRGTAVANYLVDLSHG